MAPLWLHTSLRVGGGGDGEGMGGGGESRSSQGLEPLKQARLRERAHNLASSTHFSLGESWWSICLGLKCKAVHGARGARKRSPTTGVTDEAIGVIQAPHCLACLSCSVDSKPTFDTNAYGRRGRKEQWLAPQPWCWINMHPIPSSSAAHPPDLGQVNFSRLPSHSY